MSISTKNNALILKSGSFARNCACCTPSAPEFCSQCCAANCPPGSPLSGRSCSESFIDATLTIGSFDTVMTLFSRSITITTPEQTLQTKLMTSTGACILESSAVVDITTTTSDGESLKVFGRPTLRLIIARCQTELRYSPGIATPYVFTNTPGFYLFGIMKRTLPDGEIVTGQTIISNFAQQNFSNSFGSLGDIRCLSDITSKTASGNSFPPNFFNPSPFEGALKFDVQSNPNITILFGSAGINPLP